MYMSTWMYVLLFSLRQSKLNSHRITPANVQLSQEDNSLSKCVARQAQAVVLGFATSAGSCLNDREVQEKSQWRENVNLQFLEWFLSWKSVRNPRWQVRHSKVVGLSGSGLTLTDEFDLVKTWRQRLSFLQQTRTCCCHQDLWSLMLPPTRVWMSKKGNGIFGDWTGQWGPMHAMQSRMRTACTHFTEIPRKCFRWMFL